jgi:hypothetical protein
MVLKLWPTIYNVQSWITNHVSSRAGRIDEFEDAVLMHPVSPHSNHHSTNAPYVSIIREWCRRPICGRSTKGLSLTPLLKINCNNFINENVLLTGRDSTVGVVTRLRTGRPRNLSSIPGRGMGFFSIISRPAVGPTHPPIQSVPGATFPGQSGRGVKLTTHLHLVSGG